jgi:5-methylcytosine-specific restriction endonuclease McrA
MQDVQTPHKKEYLDYIRSPWWVARKAAIIRHRGYQCERCSSTRHLELHHKTYERLKRERPEDVELLCRICHLREHGIAIHERLWGLQPLDFQSELETVRCPT